VDGSATLRSPAQAHRALVVDDVELERERIGGILRAAGWEVGVAGSGLEAIERARAERPNIIFMDIVMPGMDGFEACRRLARDPSTRSIPVVFVSTKSQRADQLWARIQGGKDLIGKPYTASQLLDALKHAV
jgi:twitching motility two-component system response regulator PilH